MTPLQANHTLALPLYDGDFGRHTVAQWANQNPETLVVFVHGFRGGCYKSWGAATACLTVDPNFASCDLIYFDFESVGGTIQRLALQLKAICTAAVNGPLTLSEYSRVQLDRAPALRYKRIILVCHSLGAAIARRCILDGLKAGETWPAYTRLILFAPAHMGANTRTLIALTLGGLFGRVCEGLFRIRFPVLDELEPRSSALDALFKETESLLEHNRSVLEAASVIMADVERVVLTTPFHRDPVPAVIPGTNHTTVCKFQNQPDIARAMVTSGL